MNTVLWVFLLCTQGYLLTHANACADGDMDCDSGQVQRAKSRVLKHTNSDYGRGAHPRQVNLPGTYTAKGSPNTLIQNDRSRRHLKKNHPKPRAGIYSLLSNKSTGPPKVVRVRRHAGAAADLAMTVKQRPRRRVPKKKNTKATKVCS